LGTSGQVFGPKPPRKRAAAQRERQYECLDTASGDVSISARVQEGYPAQVLIDAAAGADLLVVGSGIGSRLRRSPRLLTSTMAWAGVIVIRIGTDTYQEIRMRLNSKGQVTIPAPLRERHGLHEGDEVDVIEDGETLRIVRAEASSTRGQRLVHRMRGRATTTMSTDELLDLLRGE
jgi:AbrB family looped-hinge helix DNA binding protein